MRTHKNPATPPMTRETQEELIAALEARYPGQVWRVVEVCPVAVVKSIDNETDARETIRRLKAAPLPRLPQETRTPEEWEAAMHDPS